MAQKYGYTGYYKPPNVPKTTTAIAQAAGSRKPAASDPFGLLTDTTDSARVAQINATPKVPAHTVIPASTAASSSAIPFHETPQIQPTNTAPTAPAAYDIHTDPALQETDALTGKNTADAQAAALAQKQAQLLAYGDPALARKLLGDETIATAAGANPTSTLAQLGTQHDQKLHDLTEQMNQANLLYGGYRITQEDQAAKDYQNAIAQAAAGVNSNIGSIDAQLAQALATGDQTHIQALLDAYNRHKDDPGAATAPPGGDGTTDQPPANDPGGLGGIMGSGLPAAFLDANDPNVDRLALAARGRVPARSVGY